MRGDGHETRTTKVGRQRSSRWVASLAPLVGLSAVLSVTLPACSNDGTKGGAAGMMEPSDYSKFDEFEVEHFDKLFSASVAVTIRGPLGYFDQAEPAHQFRVLAANGDGLGGIAVDLSNRSDIADRYSKAAGGGKTIWLVVEGKVKQFETKDMLNRTAMPDAVFTESKVLGFYETAKHSFAPVVEP